MRSGFWVRLLLLMFLINLLFYGPFFFSLLSSQSTTIDLPYSRFLQQVEQGNVTSVTIKSDNSVTGTFKTPVRQQQSGAAKGSVAATRFTTFIPATGDPSLLPLLEKKGVEVSAQLVQPSWWQTALGLLLNAQPVLLLLYFGVMSWRGMRQMQDLQGGGLFGIGRSRARLYSEERPTTTFILAVYEEEGRRCRHPHKRQDAGAT